jgi:hypothetical protein
MGFWDTPEMRQLKAERRALEHQLKFEEQQLREAERELRDAERERRQFLAGLPDAAKEALLEHELEAAKGFAGAAEVARVEGLDEDQVELELAAELSEMKERSRSEYLRFLASLPREERDNIRQIEQKYGF